MTSFKSGDSVVGTTWQYMVNLMGREKPPVPVTAIVPKEGTTGWSDTWMINSKAAHPNCMYLWMDYIISPGGECEGRGVLRRGAVEREGLRPDHRPEPLHDVPRGRRGVLGERLLLEHARRRTAATTAVRSARPTRTGGPPGPRSRGSAAPHDVTSITTRAAAPGGPGRRLSTFFFRHPRLQARRCCSPLPLGVAGGRLPRLARRAPPRGVLGHSSRSTSRVVHDWNLDNFQRIVEEPVYRDVALPHGRAWRSPSRSPTRCSRFRSRTTWRGSRRRARRNLLVVAVLTPLWASYLVKAYAWRTILGEQGVINWLLEPVRRSRAPGTRRTGSGSSFTYLWLPFMILPIYAGLERIPRVAARGVGRSRRAVGSDVLEGDAAARVPGGRRRLDLHVLAHARRLHPARADRRTSSSSAP